jgi:hypothetical protein
MGINSIDSKENALQTEEQKMKNWKERKRGKKESEH